MMKAFCRVGWHTWGRWTETSRGDIVVKRLTCGVDLFPDEPPTKAGEFVRQERCCLHCGRLQLHTVRNYSAS